MKDYRMTRLTFGVSALSFAANMGVKQNAIVHEHSHLQAALAVRDSFYVDDGLTFADSLTEAICRASKGTTEYVRERRILIKEMEIERSCCPPSSPATLGRCKAISRSTIG